MCRCSTPRSPRTSWPGAPATRTGRQPRAVAAELAGLPLALEQAAAYIQAVGSTLAVYLALFQQRRAELLARGEPTGYDKTVASTWALAFDRLQTAAPGCGRPAAAAGVSTRPRRSRCACCFNPARGSPNSLARR